MSKIAMRCWLFVLTRPAFALENGQASYFGGTATVPAGMIGKLNPSVETALLFEYSSGKLAIPYADLWSYEYSDPVTRHLGVLPAIAVGLVAHRQHRHFFRISYRDEKSLPQVAIFEVSSQMPRTLQAVLENRTPKTYLHLRLP